MDSKLLKTGALVEVTAFRGEVLARRVVEIFGDTVYICREEEWQTAKTQGREPECVGFNQRFVVRVIRTGD